VDADLPLKALFRLRARDLLGLTGDQGARVLSARVLELPASKRSVDTVLRLRLGRQVYLRHVEFEMRYRRGLELRLFEYAARLVTQFRLPVVTTVVFLRSPAPRGLVHRETIAGRLVHERRFQVVRLWEMEPGALLAMGPGPSTLVGRTRRCDDDHIREAVRLISRSTTAPVRNDLLYVLQAFCGERYTVQELERMIPREAVMASVMFAKEFRQARAEARAEGLRSGCLDLVKHLHPATLERVAPAIAACRNVATLRKWTLAAARLSAAEFVRLVSAKGPATAAVSRRRAPRPARRSASRRRG
jgi:hypothetical protein